MKNFNFKILLILAAIITFTSYTPPQTQLTAKQIIDKATENRFGKSSYGEMKMQIVRPKYTRTIEMKTWSLGDDYSMVYITAPAKEQGQVFLKREKEMWNWVPSISRMIKLPPSMMSQGWMGSDYTNDDVINSTSIIDNYEHKLLGEEKFGGYDCYKIQSTPKPGAKIVWGKKITWISKEGYYAMKTESYDEDAKLVRTETSADIKTFGKHKLPSKFTIVGADKPQNKTIFELVKMDFEYKLDETFFTQANMKRVK